MKESLLNSLSQIRAILKCEKDLEISSLETHYAMAMKLNCDLQLRCLVHQSIDSLLIKNLDDLRLDQLSQSNSFESIQNYFSRLVRQADSFTSLYLIIQLIQEHSLLLSRAKHSLQSTLLPERCQFLTWNILLDLHSNLYPTERYERICQLLESSLPDLICFQAVSRAFLQLLSKKKWLQEHRYFVISTDQCSSHPSGGQLMLMKNFRPQWYEISPSDSEGNQYIHARFRLRGNASMDIINFHGKSLELILHRIQSSNVIIMGDFTLEDERDECALESSVRKSTYHLVDLWKEVYDLDEDCGHTFDGKRNLCAQRTSQFRMSSRTDRYFLHKLSNLSYTIESLRLVGEETIQIEDQLDLHPSDHFGLQLSVHFRVRCVSDHSRLMIRSTEWIELFTPFFQLRDTEDDQEDLLLPLRLFLAQYDKFEPEILPKLQQLFRSFIRSQSRFSIGQCSNLEIIRYIYVVRQILDHPRISFEITHQIPIGGVLEPIRFDRGEYIDADLRDFFLRMNLYPNEQIFEQKQEKYRRLSECFEKSFGGELLHAFRYLYLPYGSFRLGLNGDDLDTVFVLYETKSTNKRPSKLDQTFHRLKLDSLKLIDYLQRHLLQSFANELIECRNIQALYPIISIVFADQTKVEIFVQIMLNEQTDDQRTLHGIDDLERLIIYVRYPILFQYALTFVRSWAQNVGIYGQVYGYLGGYSWAILCAAICRQCFPAHLSSFSLKEFSLLIESFFTLYSNFDWSSEALYVHSNHFSRDNRGSMRILCPTKPYKNTARSTTDSTRSVIIQAFRTAREKSLEEILQLPRRFPDQRVQSILQLTLSARTRIELHQWLGYMKSRLAHFLADCENDCHLFVQTETRLSGGKHSLERLYFLGFDQNEQALSRHREFYYSVNRFFDQFKIYPSRSETMQISYKLMSVRDFSLLNISPEN